MNYKLLAKLSRSTESAPPKTDWLGKAIVIAGVLVSASSATVAGLNYVSTRENSQYSGFRTASDAEDKFWKDLYGDYLGLFEQKDDASKEGSKARAEALADIIEGHEIPAFAEFSYVPIKTRCTTIIRSETIRTNIINNLVKWASSDTDLAKLLDSRLARKSAARDAQCEEIRKGQQDALIKAESSSSVAEEPQENAVVPEGPAPEPSTPVANEAVPGAVALGSEELPKDPKTEQLSPSSDTGWDVDIFWCRGDVENYRRAAMLSREFAKLATSGQAIGPGVTLGRVRLRPALPNYQQIEPRISRQPTVVADTGPGEADAAAALQNSGNTLLGTPMIRTARSIGAPTRWYLSMFMCGAAKA
ncbi:MAG: hypothetical protein ACAH11_07035 [Sphingomonas sp.]